MQEHEPFEKPFDGSNNISSEAREGGATAGKETSFELLRFLESVTYPADKDDIIDYATDQGVESVVLEMLEQLPDTTFNSPADVNQALGENSKIVT